MIARADVSGTGSGLVSQKLSAANVNISLDNTFSASLMARYTDTFVFAVALFLFSGLHFGDAWNIRFPQPTVAAQLLRRNATLLMDRRDEIVTDMTTCGYLNGDPKKIRTANSGFNCRVDTLRGIWGFCPTTVIAATDCGFAVACIDSKSCSDGCGQLDNTKLTTWTW